MEWNHEVHAEEALPRPTEAVAQINQLLAYTEVPQESTGFSPFQLLYRRSVRGPGMILKKLWTKEVNIPEVRPSYKYVTEPHECLEDLLKLAHQEM